MLDLVRLPGVEDRMPAQLSGGQAQRVALARALIGQPQVLLLDEPLAALDLKLRKAMQLELRRIQEELGTSFLYVTHDQEEALTMSDKIVLMNEGRIAQEGSPAEIYDRPANVFASGFIGEANLLRGAVQRPTASTARVTLDDGLAQHCRAGQRPGVRPAGRRFGAPGTAALLAGRGAPNGAEQSCAGHPGAPHLPGQHRARQFVALGPDLVVMSQRRRRCRALAARASRSKSPGGQATRSCCRRRRRDRRRRVHAAPAPLHAAVAARRGLSDAGCSPGATRSGAALPARLPGGSGRRVLRVQLLDRRWLRPGAGLDA